MKHHKNILESLKHWKQSLSPRNGKKVEKDNNSKYEATKKKYY